MRGLQRIGAVLALAIPLSGCFKSPPSTAPVAYISGELPAERRFGKWLVYYLRDEMSDRAGIYASMLAENNPYIKLHLHCWGRAVEGEIEWDAYIDSAKRAYVQYRTKPGSLSSTYEALSKGGDQTELGLDMYYLLRRLRLSTRFVARVTRYDDTTITAVFDTREAKEVVDELLRACGERIEEYD